ncbi:MAG: PIG-L family deacetylase [Planctomycetaceae bacterium]|nr:PIG-L family deacetylase [Planctomycetales bacterium]MCB9927711.1 PIG-L family deacetylase [Planctomycetaceae bacterium]
MTIDSPRMLVLGAHPDDAEFHAGGLISIYRERGYAVKIVSVTNGAAGHHERTAEELINIRASEAAAVGQMIGAEYEVWEYPDGGLQPTLEVRHRIIREIRNYAPDLVLTHRLNDYHPDHRAVGQLVQDASYLVTVPLVASDTKSLRKDPVVAYMPDLFTKPNPLSPDVVVDTTAYMERIVAMLDCHRSQVYEWLPYNGGVIDQVPADDEGKREWLAGWFAKRARAVADRFRSQLVDVYGEQLGSAIEFAEAYEISEYATSLSDEAKQRLFPVAKASL